MNNWPDKDPAEVLDYGLDYSAEMTKHGDTIANSTYALLAGDVTLGSEPAIANHTPTIFLSGGTDNTISRLLHTVVSTGGRTYKEEVNIRIKAK